MSLKITVAPSVADRATLPARGITTALLEEDAGAFKRRGFGAEIGESVLMTGADGIDELVVGLGEPGGLDAEALRRVGAAIARGASHVDVVAFDLDTARSALDRVSVARNLAEGAALATYRFSRFKSDPIDDELAELILVAPDADAVANGVARAHAVADATALARDLVNAPAGDLTPRRFAEIATEVAANAGLTIEVLSEEEIAAERLGGLLGVAAGSEEPARFIRLSYQPDDDPEAPVVALVGKGITFDSGGLSIKTAASMMTMKTDMGGAASVLGALSACRELRIAVAVRGYLPVTENMPGGGATRPGDVLVTRNGKTIEVLNTDAEGRLVLADGLSLAVEGSPDAIVDLATLTGACVAALGVGIAGVIGNDDRLISQVRAAAGRAGEPVWPLPLPAGYHSHIESEVADMKNLGVSGQAGALSAALLLQEFVGSVPWVHLDIAGPVRSEEDKGYLRKGATGFGVRTILELLGSYTPLGGVVDSEAEGVGVLR